jgi:ankyrin repeat protein
MIHYWKHRYSEERFRFCPSGSSLKPAMNCRTSYQASVALVLSLAFSGFLRAAPIHDAALAGNVAKISALLAADPKLLNATDNYGFTPLICAAEKGHIETVMLLLDKGAAVEGKHDSVGGALFGAAQYGHMAVVKLLLEKGAAVDRKDSLGQTPLMMAVRNGHNEIVQLLLDKGAAFDAKANNGFTPLMFAAFDGHVDLVRLFGASFSGERSGDRRKAQLWGHATHVGGAKRARRSREAPVGKRRRGGRQARPG